MNMKKKFVMLAMGVLIALLLSACVKLPETIVLSFDKNTAYFNGSVALEPITGEEPAESDLFERADMKLTANAAVRMRVRLEYASESEDVEGLMIRVNGQTAESVTNGMVLYTSSAAESEATVELTIFLHKDTPQSARGKTIGFTLILEYEVD